MANSNSAITFGGIPRSRREFLRRARGCFSAMAAASAVGPLGQMSANAQTADGYRALVCVFLFGGNDSNNSVVPMTATEYTNYATARGPLALPQSSLLPITASGVALGLHPSLRPLQELFQLGRLAVVANVGNLVMPVTRTAFQNRTVPVPTYLFSHSDQQSQWQSSNANGVSATGWSGRALDQVRTLNGASTFPSAMSTSGAPLQLLGDLTRPAQLPSSTLELLGSGTLPGPAALERGLQQVLALPSGATLVQTANAIQSQGLDAMRTATNALRNLTPLQTIFPATGLGQQLAQVSRLIQVRGAAGLQRQVFFCAQSGYDTHDTHLARQAELLTELADAVRAFSRAMDELGVSDRVTLFTESEFSRTMQANTANGTDHAWGGHQFVVGAAVRAGLYGRLPELRLGGPDDAGQWGTWIPTLATDQYAATLARWFGVPDAAMPVVAPHIGNFAQRYLSFLG